MFSQFDVLFWRYYLSILFLVRPALFQSIKGGMVDFPLGGSAHRGRLPCLEWTSTLPLFVILEMLICEVRKTTIPILMEMRNSGLWKLTNIGGGRIMTKVGPSVLWLSSWYPPAAAANDSNVKRKRKSIRIELPKTLFTLAGQYPKTRFCVWYIQISLVEKNCFVVMMMVMMILHVETNGFWPRKLASPDLSGCFNDLPL